MKNLHVRLRAGLLSIVTLYVSTTGVEAQTFSSGSNESLGAFAPVANTTITLPPDGVLNYTTVNIPTGVTVSFAPNAANTPVTMLATGDIVIAGIIQVNGFNGLDGQTDTNNPGSPAQNPGARGGPGGFAGGAGGVRGLANTVGAAGLGPGGGPQVVSQNGGSYGAPATFVSLLPLFGGSGGGGAYAGVSGGNQSWSGASGGGGGGAIVIASTTKITVTGSITANGGRSGNSNFTCGSFGYAGPGSGGAIRLVAPEISNTGSLQAVTGTSSHCSNVSAPDGGAGRIRIEALVFGTIAPTTPVASLVNALGPVTATSVPALLNLPTLTFTSVGGVAPPANPGGSYTVPDVTLPPTTTNPVPVVLTATNTPVPTPFTIRLIPRVQLNFTSQTVSSTGSFTLSTVSANVNFPNGQISALQAFAGFTLTASLAPMIDGEPAEQVLMAAGYGEPSSLTLVTKSGKQVLVSELPLEDQLKVAQAFEAMRHAR